MYYFYVIKFVTFAFDKFFTISPSDLSFQVQVVLLMEEATEISDELFFIFLFFLFFVLSILNLFTSTKNKFIWQCSDFVFGFSDWLTVDR